MYEYIKDKVILGIYHQMPKDPNDNNPTFFTPATFHYIMNALNEALGDIQKYKELFAALQICGEENILKRIKEILAENEKLKGQLESQRELIDSVYVVLEETQIERNALKERIEMLQKGDTR